MTQPELTEAIANVLQGNQPITALIHRNAEGLIIAELYNAASRGAVLATVAQEEEIEGGDEIIIIRDGLAKRVPSTAIASQTFKYSIIPSGDVDGVNNEFTFPEPPATGTLRLFVDQGRLKVGDDYTLVGAVVTTVVPPTSFIMGDYQL